MGALPSVQVVPLDGHILWPLLGNCPKYAKNMPKICPQYTLELVNRHQEGQGQGEHFQVLRQLTMLLLSSSMHLEWTSLDQIVPLGGHILRPLLGNCPKYAHNIPYNWCIGTKRARGGISKWSGNCPCPFCPVLCNWNGLVWTKLCRWGGAHITATFGKLLKICQEYPPELVNGHQEGQAATSKCSGN